MSKYKICPACGEKNPPLLLECTACEADLSGVRVLDEDAERMIGTDSPIGGSDSEEASFWKCECGRVNPEDARFCLGCGEPSPAEPAERMPDEVPPLELRSLDGAASLRLDKSETVVGRECSLGAYLSGKPYVSRKHAVLLTRDGGAFIRNLSATNGTYVNNEPIAGEVMINPGDEIGLGGLSIDGSRQAGAAYFIVGRAE